MLLDLRPDTSHCRKIECSFFTLQFNSRQQEVGFISSRSALLASRAKIGAVLAFLVSGVGLTTNFFVRQYHLESSWRSATEAWCGKMSIYHGVGCCGILLLYRLGLSCPLPRISRPMCTEYVTSAVLMLLMSTGILASPTHLAGVMGVDTSGDDAPLLMMIVGTITGAHVALPLRWCVLLPLDILAVTVYGVIVFLGKTTGFTSGLYCLALLAAIVAMGTLGKRAAELGERAAWRELIKERSLRCQAEFDLSQERFKKEKGRPKDVAAESQAESRVESIPQTTVSGHVFEPLYANDNTSAMEVQLLRLAEMGDAEHWRVKEREVRIMTDEVLGTGAFGVVSKGIFCGLVVAVKRSLQLDAAGLGSTPQLCNELRVLRHLRHPNIVATHGAVVNPSKREIALVLELVPGVTLTRWMASSAQQKRSSTLKRFQVMIGVCRALLYMHTRFPHIIHGDLKSGNIMVQVTGENAHAKLLDFGLSRVVTRNSRRLGGTLAWVAPEVLWGAPAKCSADVYSFGRVIALLATGISLQDQFKEASLRSALKNGRVPLPKWPRDCPFEPSTAPLVRSCLLLDEAQRPKMAEAYRMLLEVPNKIGLIDIDGDFLAQLSYLAEREAQSAGDKQAAQKVETGFADDAAQENAQEAAQDDYQEASPGPLDSRSYVEASLPEFSASSTTFASGSSTSMSSWPRQGHRGSILSTMYEEEPPPRDVVPL